MASICIRKALLRDAPMLEQWHQQDYLKVTLGEDDWQWAQELQQDPPWREQLIAELDGEPMGFMEIIDPALEESHYWGDCPANLRAMDIWIGVPALLGQGYGTQMMGMALERCFADKAVEGVLLDPLASNTKAHGFYERFGFVKQAERWFGEDLCYVYYLDRENWGGSLSDC